MLSTLTLDALCENFTVTRLLRMEWIVALQQLPKSRQVRGIRYFSHSTEYYK